MKVPLAWRSVTHAKIRSSLAVAGIGVAILLIFMQLGLIGLVRDASAVILDAMDYDLIVVSRNYTTLAAPGHFARRRLYQALAHSQVKHAKPVYLGSAQWRNQESGTYNSIFVMGVDPRDGVFQSSEIRDYSTALIRRDTLIVDRLSGGPGQAYGSLDEIQSVQVNRRTVSVIGKYTLGFGMVDLGATIVSDQNFLRLLEGASLENVSLGLLKLELGIDPDVVAQELKSYLGQDVNVFSRSEFRMREARFWLRQTSTGTIFGSGAVVAYIVGIVVLYQSLSSQVRSYLSQFATLKALGYSHRYLVGWVFRYSILISLCSYVPAIAIACCLYYLLQRETGLPMRMTLPLAGFVLLSVILMSTLAGVVAMRKVFQADPAELF